MSIIQGSAMQGATRGFYPRVIEGSLRFNDDDSAYLSWTPDSAGNRKTWTLSFWIKRNTLGTNQSILTQNPSGSNIEGVFFNTSDKLELYQYDGAFGYYFTTTQVFRDPSSWYHIVAKMDSTQATSTDRFELYVNGQKITAFDNNTYPSQNNEEYFNTAAEHRLGHDARNSNYFDSYLADVHFIDGQALDADDFGETKNGVWVAKDYTGTYGTNGFLLTFEDDTEVEAFNTVLYRGDGSGNQSITGMGMNADLYWIKRRDAAGGWNCVDTVRGPHKRLELHSTGADYDQTLLQSFDSDGFTTGVTGVGESGGSYVAFGWDAGANNAVTGHSSVTYRGTGSTAQRVTGFPFSPDLLWLKCRGAAENHNLMDTVRGWGKRLKTNTTDAEQTFSGGGFYEDGFAPETTSDDQNKNATDFVAWAWDAGDSDPVSNTDGTITSTVKSNGDFSIISYDQGTLADANIGHGLSAAPDFLIIKNRDLTSPTVVYHSAIGASQRLVLHSGDAASASGNIFGSGQTDPDSTKFYVGAVSWVNNTGGNKHIAYAWRNVTGKQKFDSYTGDGTTDGTKTITTGFRPGFIMIKCTSSGSTNWIMMDSSREPLGTLELELNANNSNQEYNNGRDITFSDTGFTVAGNNNVNGNGDTYIYAAFAGSYSDYITDYNTDGTNIDSRVKANQTTGFSICSYEGSGTASDSFGHGLGASPSMVIIKDRQLTNSWLVQHSSVTGYLTLNATNAVAGTNQLTFGASTVTLNGTWDIMNGSGRSYIAYCWTEKTGYSKFGSYTGNGTSTGPTVTCGFKPAFLMIKRTDSTHNWYIFDSTRTTTNPQGYNLMANSSAAEDGPNNIPLDFLSNGFQPKGSGASQNASGGTYIYAAFADTREAAFWLDQSSNDNDWQPVNLDHNDTVADSPTDNFCTWNPLQQSSNLVLSDGNLVVNNSTAEANHRLCVATHGMTSGKYYWEIYVNNSANVDMVGIVGQNADMSTHIGGSGFAIGYSTSAGNYYKASGWSDDGTAPPNGFPASGTIGVAFDADAKKIYFHLNGEYLNSADPVAGTGANGSYSGSETTFFPAISIYNNTGKWTANFGQQPFKYGPPE
jgi:hypothetical protein